jgi:hypothetical protein
MVLTRDYESRTKNFVKAKHAGETANNTKPHRIDVRNLDSPTRALRYMATGC